MSAEEQSAVIETCVLYDILNWKTAESSYETMRQMLGNDMISFDDYQSIFVKKVQTNWDETINRINLRDFLMTNKFSMRTCILNDVINGVSIDRSYRKVLEIVGNIRISYPTFDFWYYWFYNGKRDLFYDISKHPRPTTFSQLPVDALNKILNYTELRDHICLEKVSRGLRSVISERTPLYESIEMICDDNWISVSFNDLNICYRNTSIVSTCLYEPLRGALRDIMVALRNPKLHLESLEISYHWEKDREMRWFAEQIKNEIKSLNHQLSVRKITLKVSNEAQVHAILPFLKAGILEEIDIYGIDIFWMQNFGTYNIIQMDQYNKAKLVRIMFSTGFFLFDRISDAVLCGFKFYCLTMDTLFSLRNIFSRSPTFKHCNIECVYLPLIEELAVELGLRLEPGNYLPVFYEYLIPDSTDVLIYEFWMDHIEIRRVSYMEML
ncbi:hypothetical protein GCK72_021176 [Caenorhabditis remanei]|uniref:F-box domain-containing protein n=1 Tax=Caenorhabditis remanei TaxID=31234 RepID=A0A6A5GIV0_CAERE|nr:hypothetical protein GCK72_021176 [Caenorhabditis remanei]KAF1754613.1 hypothetical protein GCK72_021176 [Caenorhabditis remanei]